MRIIWRNFGGGDAVEVTVLTRESGLLVADVAPENLPDWIRPHAGLVNGLAPFRLGPADEIEVVR